MRTSVNVSVRGMVVRTTVKVTIKGMVRVTVSSDYLFELCTGGAKTVF